MNAEQRDTLTVLEHLASLDCGRVESTIEPGGAVRARVENTCSAWNDDEGGFSLLISPSGAVRLT